MSTASTTRRVGKGNATTARDLSKIARLLLAHHPEALEWSSTRRKPFRNGKFMLRATNRLLGRFQGLDGLKTGYTRRAGSCLVSTASRRDMRLISVILGAPSTRVRDRETRRLLSWGFANFSRVPLVETGQRMGKVVLDWGIEPEVGALAQDTIVAVLTREQEKLARPPPRATRGIASTGRRRRRIGQAARSRWAIAYWPWCPSTLKRASAAWGCGTS